MTDYEIKLLNCFPGSFVNHNVEFIADLKSNQYFILGDVENEFQCSCKVLEWLSRSASKGEPYRANAKNCEYQDKMLRGINAFLGTEFSHEDMELIYQELGNSINRKLTEAFIRSAYCLDVLKEGL